MRKFVTVLTVVSMEYLKKNGTYVLVDSCLLEVHPVMPRASSVLRLDQSNYYAYFYLKGIICPMSMKLSRKFLIGVVIYLPKYFASHFGHVTLKQLITFTFFTQKWGTFILQIFENVWH